MATSGVSRASRALRPIGWAMAVLFASAVVVQVTHTGIDIVLMLCAGFVLLVLERTLGDWIAETIGAPATVLVFALFASAAVVYALSPDGRARVNRLFAVAESRGYRPAYFVADDPHPAEDENTVAARRDGVQNAAAGNAPEPAGVEKTPEQVAATSAQATPVATRGIFDWSGSGPDKTVRLRLRADPDVVVTGQKLTLYATVESGDGKSPLAALFTVNGAFVAKVTFDASGQAATQFTPAVPGQYTARLRLAAGTLFGQEVSTAFNVLPGSVPRAR